MSGALVPGSGGTLRVPLGMSARAGALMAVPVWPMDDERRTRGRAGVARAGRRAAAEAGPSGAGLVSSYSARHAEGVWKVARAHVAAHAARLAQGAPPDARPGLWQIAFVSGVAGHVAECGRCQVAGRYGREGDTPAAWLSWALVVTPEVADVWGAVARSEGVRLDRTPPRLKE